MPTQRTSLSRQRGIAASKLLIIIVSIVLLALVYKYVRDKDFFGLSTSTITNPIQRANPFQNLNPFTDDFAGFGVQVVASTNLDEAKKVMNKFAGDGYSAFIVETDQRGSSLYLVRLGPYSRDEANAINDKIKRRYKRSPYVRDSFVVYREG